MTKKTTRAEKSLVALVKTNDRKRGVVEALKLVAFPPMTSKKVFIKPNFNTADPAPGSTHVDVLAALIEEIQNRDAAAITVGDRSGPADTQEVLKEKGIIALGEKMGFSVINFEAMPDTEWVLIEPPGSHWEGGFLMARPLVEAEYIVTTGCLKTLGFGGHFTMSLKLSVGAVHRKHMMPQLHGSPHMRDMIAEINLGYRPQLILLDGVDVYTDGGPMTGEKKTGDVIIAGTDRVAVDAVGLAVLKELGANPTIMDRNIFDQDQIKRAVALNIGISGPQDIEIITPDEKSRDYADRLNAIISQG
jgi:uncharacterized protein (DUF362 family)